MQELLQTLQDHDLGHLRAVAELWGFDPPKGSALEAAQTLSQAMLDPQALAEIHAGLPADASRALDQLLLRGGRLPLAEFSRRVGLLRRMGPGKRDREKPWRNPVSPLELLWYHGLIATAFADTPTGPKDFAFIPSDVMALLPQPTAPQTPFVPPAEPPAVQLASATTAVDDAATLLAALRRRPSPGLELDPDRKRELLPFLFQPGSLQLLLTLLIELGILDSRPLQPNPSAARDFLALPKHQALAQLLRTWVASRGWNDLAHVPTLVVSAGAWPNDPLAARAAVLAFLHDLSLSDWHEIGAFVGAVRERQPDFQRPGADFDSWYLQQADTGTFLQGFEAWDQIEGALLQFMIQGPLHWLGAVDLGRPSSQRAASVFSLSVMASALFDSDFLPKTETEPLAADVRPDGRITVPRQTPPAIRYQISRFCSWLPPDDAGYQFLLSPSSLQHAHEQGLQLKHIKILLAEACQGEVPPRLLKALERWGTQGKEAHLEHDLVLRVKEPSLLDDLLAQRATARYLGERLGPTSVLVRPRDVQPLLAAAARFGLLIDPPASMGGPP